jgi:hypothetical protein
LTSDLTVFISLNAAGEIEFRADGHNHFVSSGFPAHSHWTMQEDGKVDLDWGKYGRWFSLLAGSSPFMYGWLAGKYELQINADAQSMEGSKAGQPGNWRRVRFIRPLGTDALSSVPSHDHSHSHAHGESCHHDEGSCDHKHEKDCCDHKDEKDCCDHKH